MENSKKLTGRDLISIGIFNAIMFVIMIVVGIPMGVVPIIYLFYVAVMALINGVVFMLLAAKVPKRGMLLITCTLQGLLFLVNGGFLTMLPCIIAGLIAEVAFALVKGKKGAIVGYIIYALGVFASSFGPMIVAYDWFFSYFESVGYSAEYTRQIFDNVLGPIGIIALILTIVFALVGSLIGIRIFKKHFKKAGIV